MVYEIARKIEINSFLFIMLMPELQQNPEKLMLELLEKQILLMNQMLQIKEWWIWGMCMWYDTSHIYFETFQVWINHLKMHEIDVSCQE